MIILSYWSYCQLAS